MRVRAALNRELTAFRREELRLTKSTYFVK